MTSIGKLIPKRMQGPIAAILYAACWAVLYRLAAVYWFAPAGLRAAVLLISPMRWWPWYAVAEIAVVIALVSPNDYQFTTSWLLALIGPIACQVLVIGLYRLLLDPEPLADRRRTVGSTLVLIGALALAALLTAVLLTIMWQLEGRVQPDGVNALLLLLWIGDSVAMVSVVPIVVALALPGRRRLVAPALVMELAGWTALALLPAAWLALNAPQFENQALSLAMVPTIGMAARHGWRGAALSLFVTSFVVYAMQQGQPNEQASVAQLNLILFGTASMLVGSAVSELRASKAALEKSVRELAHSNERLQVRTSELRELGARLARIQDDEQVRIGRDIEDEMEQTIVELGARFGMAAREATSPAAMAAIDSMREMLRGMHATIRSITRRLGNISLDHPWTSEALLEGPIGQFLGDAGIELSVGISGASQAFGPEESLGLLRICHLIASDVVRDSRAIEVHISMWIDEGPVDATNPGAGPTAWLTIHERAQPGQLASRQTSDPHLAFNARVRDRIASLGGTYRLQADASGLVHSIALPLD